MRAAGVQLTEIELNASEKAKSLETFGRILAAMGAARLERNDPVIALGGGITGDVAGFAAASYRRGVPVIQCPTTLLSMVDASVGGKTGVNLDAGGSLQKNMVGAFHQPTVVVADIGTLSTLPDREFRAGLAECLKHGLLDSSPGAGGRTHLTWITDSLDRILARDPTVLVELIARSVAFKAGVVRGDERETAESGGGRALLNLGHTFAHAIETLHHLSPTDNPGDAPLLHGEAVGLGLVACATTAVRMGLAPAALPEQISTLLTRCWLPASVRGLPDARSCWRLMGADKKTTGGKLRLVLPCKTHHARAVEILDHAPVLAGWDAIRME
ncbi:MAG: 3-dehydroquinate synthase [Planctomycetota bacterium]|nr:MAG: 3-dehydroquinate synthase [Planctomycetota bacterium]